MTHDKAVQPTDTDEYFNGAEVSFVVAKLVRDGRLDLSGLDETVYRRLSAELRGSDHAKARLRSRAPRDRYACSFDPLRGLVSRAPHDRGAAIADDCFHCFPQARQRVPAYRPLDADGCERCGPLMKGRCRCRLDVAENVGVPVRVGVRGGVGVPVGVTVRVSVAVGVGVGVDVGTRVAVGVRQGKTGPRQVSART